MRIRFIVSEFAIGIPDEIWQRVMNPRQVLTIEPTGYVLIEVPMPRKTAVELVEQFLEWFVVADACVEYKLHTPCLRGSCAVVVTTCFSSLNGGMP